jgi:galactokinase
MLQKSREELTAEQYNRVSFVLKENRRVLKAAELIKKGELKNFGKLMYDSHYGLRDLYEVSCRELDFLVAFTEDKEYIYGSRMMGGGFGGCTLNLIQEDHIREFSEEVSKAYNNQFGFEPDIITVTPDEGTKVTFAGNTNNNS